MFYKERTYSSMKKDEKQIKKANKFINQSSFINSKNKMNNFNRINSNNSNSNRFRTSSIKKNEKNININLDSINSHRKIISSFTVNTKKKNKSKSVENESYKEKEIKKQNDNLDLKLFFNSLQINLNFLNIPFNELNILKSNIIHYSDLSTIYKSKYLKIDICIKEYKNISKMEKNDIENIKNELQLLISIRHPNIINIIGYSFNNNYNDIYLIFEYKKYSLKNLLENNSINFTIKQKLKIIYEIALAISYLHSRENKIYHRDLKSGNILLDENYNCFICDFGMSKYNKKNNSYNNLYKTNSQSTPYWMAPEFICEGLFNEKSDIYSFGILIWEIFMKDTIPYKNVNLFDFILGNKDVVYNIRPIILDKKIKDCFEIKYLIEKMWDNDMKKRPNINEVVDFIEKLREKYNID